ncbi:MAG: sulfate permease [Fibrobacteres bacterium]|nr:sulfate permease [Fibrobacterota bacterium]
MSTFRPELLSSLQGYNKSRFLSDLSAGVIVGIVALPLAIAFAIASGVTPEKGLITAVIAGFIISALGGSRVQIGGPTGAFIIIVYGIVQQYGINGLAIATMMAGVILLVMGLFKFGSMIKFIPYPIVVGFTSGIALLIFSTQIKDFFGLAIVSVPAEFHEKWITYFRAMSTVNFYAFGVAISSLFIMIVWPRFNQRIPGSLIALIASTCVVYFLNLPVETIGSKFGDIPSSIPKPQSFDISFSVIKGLMAPAISIAILGAIESLLSAVVADGMIGTRHKSNMELVAQGIANIVTPIFGGIPATGAIARTATNIKNGARTPISGMIHALTLLLIMLFFGGLAKLIPMAALAAILIIVSYNMSEWRSFKTLLKSPRSDIIVLVTTFLLTVLIDLTVAIEIGMMLAAFLFMKRMAEVTNVSMITRELDDSEPKTPDANSMDLKKIPHGVEVYEINGPFFFGAATKFKDQMMTQKEKPKVRIIRMRNVPAIDATGLQTIRDFYKDFKKTGTVLILSGVHTQPLFAMTQAGLFDLLGEENIQGNIDAAISRAEAIIKEKENESTHKAKN